MQKIILSILIILSAIPLGLLLKHLTKEEKPIYQKYFPPLLWLTAILAAIFYTLNLQIALSLTFIFVLVLTWSKMLY
tara:strand:+ start:9060 stop:9290 length:231 start_codon:yes stop_codon:yes gene_type:complete